MQFCKCNTADNGSVNLNVLSLKNYIKQHSLESKYVEILYTMFWIDSYVSLRLSPNAYTIQQQNFLKTLWHTVLKLMIITYIFEHTSQVSMGFSPVRRRSATCFGIIWQSNSSVRRISSSSFLIDSSNFFDFCCSWSNASFNSTDCWVPANIRSLPMITLILQLIQGTTYGKDMGISMLFLSVLCYCIII